MRSRSLELWFSFNGVRRDSQRENARSGSFPHCLTGESGGGGRENGKVKGICG